MLDKIFKPTARTIKTTRGILVGCAIGSLIGAFSSFREAGSFSDSSYYYWSSAARSTAATFASLLTFLGVVFLAFGLIELALGGRLWMLEKNGKVCPKCERVYLPTETTCSPCGADLTHAMCVKDYLLTKPTVKHTANTAASASGSRSENFNAGTKRFCTSCGQEITESDAFCPKCGKKAR